MNGSNNKRRVKKQGERWLTRILVLTLLLNGVWGMMLTSFAAGDVTITIDGEPLYIEASMGAPFIDKNSRTQVPLNAAMTAIGAKVTWNGAERIAVVEKDGITVQVPIGQKYILKDGQRIDNDTEAIIKDQRTYLPIRVVMEAFGAEVGWDGTTRTVIITTEDPEMKAMWISYLEFLDMPKSEKNFRKVIDQKFDQCVEYGMNAVIVQVRADSDAMYDSEYFPWSKFASGTQGVDPGYDPLEYMIQAAHKRNLEFHAWVNPYRITGYKLSWSEVSEDNPAKVWTTDGSVKNDRNVLFHNGFYYYNPSVAEVRQLVVDGVEEIVQNYDVDGIHFDDYFYPSLSNSSDEL
ncbi:MAG: family 10 glycosylhydrolase, partial [Firmicutes bacterium]|nr:family 10 glycosylhydrolase [Bacillota bacterium]